MRQVRALQSSLVNDRNSRALIEPLCSLAAIQRSQAREHAHLDRRAFDPEHSTSTPSTELRFGPSSTGPILRASVPLLGSRGPMGIQGYVLTH